MFSFSKKLPYERQKQLKSFQKIAGIKFKDLNLLNLALIHRSAVKEHSDSNERLEFLGDSVLGLVVASNLYKYFSHYSEGELARIKAATVSEDSLASIADSLKISDYIVFGKGELMSGGKTKKALLADAVEAIIGAFYLDAGFKASESFVSRVIKKQIKLVAQHERYEDFKSILQELVQQKFKVLPRYRLEKTEGPDHDLRFWVSLDIDGRKFGPCLGKTKKDAEQAVAAIAYKHLSS